MFLELLFFKFWKFSKSLSETFIRKVFLLNSIFNILLEIIFLTLRQFQTLKICRGLLHKFKSNEWLRKSIVKTMSLLRLMFAPSFRVELILTDLVGVKKSLDSPSRVFPSCSLIFSFVLGFNSFNSSFWYSARRPLISEVISSFNEALSPSKTLFSILGDLGGRRLRNYDALVPQINIFHQNWGG